MRKKGGRQALLRAALCLENAPLAVTTIFHARLFMAHCVISWRRSNSVASLIGRLGSSTFRPFTASASRGREFEIMLVSLLVSADLAV